MTRDAYFREDDGGFVPLEIARGYWTCDSLHGRAIVGLLGHVLEGRLGDPEFVPVRFNVDMHRLPGFRPVQVQTRLIRAGGRLRLAEAVLSIDGIEHARAQCQYLRAGDEPPGRIWAPELWNAPPPEAVAPWPGDPRESLAELRPIKGSLRTFGPRQIWTCEHFDIVEGRALSPFSRLALAADFASPWVHAADRGVHYMNTDVISQVHRLPRGPWIGFETTGHEASQGIAVGQCRIYDVEGAIGFISATALANKKR